MTRMDIAPLCTGTKPKLAGRKIVNEVKTALGGDNRCGCGVLVKLAKQKLGHPPITLVFCVREVSGLSGARHVKSRALGSPVVAFDDDGGSASNVTIGTVGADQWQVAGVAPERGISSAMFLVLALADVKAERRSEKPTRQFERAAKRVENNEYKSGRVKFKTETDYYLFRMKESLPVAKRALAAASAIGGTPVIRTARGGLEANWMVRHRVPTVTSSAGQNEPHTSDEGSIYDRACAPTVQLATMRCLDSQFIFLRGRARIIGRHQPRHVPTVSSSKSGGIR